MLNYRAHGKLLLTGEYAITQGAEGLAIPTRYGQSLNYHPNTFSNEIHWVAQKSDGTTWFWANFDLTLRCLDTSDREMADRLLPLLNVVKKRTSLLDRAAVITTKLEFPNEWGLGTSSTLSSLLAQLSGTGALSDFRAVHGGSGYDIACATADGPILYHLEGNDPKIRSTEIDFEFLHDVGFVYTGRKQNTANSLELLKSRPFSDAQIDRITSLTHEFLRCKTVLELEEVIVEHENLIAEHLGLSRAQDTLFSEFPGVVKSLGGWGGDFVMVTRMAASRKWLRTNGFKVAFPFKSLSL